MCAVIVPPAGWYWQSCDCLLDPGRHFFTTAEEKSNCCCNSYQEKPAKLHGGIRNDLLTPDSRILDVSPIASGTVKRFLRQRCKRDSVRHGKRYLQLAWPGRAQSPP